MQNKITTVIISLLYLFVFAQSASCSTDIEGEQKSDISPGFIPVATGTLKQPLKPKKHQKQDSVTVCNSTSAYAYHYASCSRLKRCKAGISTLTKKQAESKGYQPCKTCN